MRKILLLLTAVICFGFSCEYDENENHHRTIAITNLSDKPVYVGSTWIWTSMPDAPNDPPRFMGNAYYIAPNETNTEAFMCHPPSTYESKLSGGTRIRIHFIDAEILESTPEGEDVPMRALLKSKIYTLEEMRAANFHLFYPAEARL